jgi:DnaK suppressor protein
MARRDALSRLTSRLIARRDALRQTLSQDIDSLRTVPGASGVGDDADAAVDSANGEIRSQLAEIESRELGQIEHALQRSAAGVYGRCEFCGDRIPAARLNALPCANSCINCQLETERRGHSRARETDSERWAGVEWRPIEEREGDAPIHLGDLKMDSRGSGRLPLDSLLV